MINQKQLKAASVFYTSLKGQNSCIHSVSKEKYQFKHFLINQRHLQLVTDVKRKGDGDPNNNVTLCIKLKFPNSKWLPRKKRGKSTKSTTKTFEPQSQIVEYINNINENEGEELANLSPSKALTKFENFIMKIGKEVAKIKVRHHPDQFMQSKSMVQFHIEC